MHCKHGITTSDTCSRCVEEQKRESGFTASSLLDDTVRMNWLNDNGRVSKFSDGWNAWSIRNRKAVAIDSDIRKAIDEAMRSVI